MQKKRLHRRNKLSDFCFSPKVDISPFSRKNAVFLALRLEWQNAVIY